jgi:hypothetical protein
MGLSDMNNEWRKMSKCVKNHRQKDVVEIISLSNLLLTNKFSVKGIIIYTFRTRILAIFFLFKELVKNAISYVLNCDENSDKRYHSCVRCKSEDVFLHLNSLSSESCLL